MSFWKKDRESGKPADYCKIMEALAAKKMRDPSFAGGDFDIAE